MYLKLPSSCQYTVMSFGVSHVWQATFKMGTYGYASFPSLCILHPLFVCVHIPALLLLILRAGMSPPLSSSPLVG